MRSIAEAPKHDRYLMVAERMSEDAWNLACRDVREFISQKPSEDSADQTQQETLRLINSDLATTYHPFVILFCYADIPAETRWNIVFDPNDLSSHESTNAIFRFGVFWRRIAQCRLEHGHHQIAVIDFPDGMPSLFDTLPVDANCQDYEHIRLCHSDDLNAIEQAIRNRGITNA